MCVCACVRACVCVCDVAIQLILNLELFASIITSLTYFWCVHSFEVNAVSQGKCLKASLLYSFIMIHLVSALLYSFIMIHFLWATLHVALHGTAMEGFYKLFRLSLLYCLGYYMKP